MTRAPASTSASFQGAATTCTPIGRPSADCDTGTDMRWILQQVEPRRIAPRVEVVDLCGLRSSTRAHRGGTQGLAPRGRAAGDSAASARGIAHFSRSRLISTSSSRSAVSFGPRRVHSRNCSEVRVHLRLAPGDHRLEQEADARPKISHHSSRASSRPSGRNSSTSQPGVCEATAAACLTASRDSAVTGTSPSSSKTPTRVPAGARHQRRERHRMAVRIADVGSRHHRRAASPRRPPSAPSARRRR